MGTLIDAANINKILLTEQGSDPSTPASGKGYLFVRDDGEIYLKNDGGNSIPLVLTVVSGTTSRLVGVKTISFQDGLTVGITGTTVYVDGLRNVGARVYNSGNVTIPNGVQTPIPFNVERWDNGSFHNNVTNNTRLTIPVGMSGIYVISGHTVWDSDTSQYRQIGIQLNGTTFLANQRISAVQLPVISVSTIYYLSAGDYVELLAVQGSGSDRTITSNGNNSPEFSIQKIG